MSQTNHKTTGIGHYFSPSYSLLHQNLTQEMKKTCQSPEIEYSRILHQVQNNMVNLTSIQMDLANVKQGHTDIQTTQANNHDYLHQYLIDISQQPTINDWYHEMNNHVADCIQTHVDTLKTDIIARSRSEKHAILVVIVTCFLAVTAFLFLIVSGKFMIP